MTVTARRRRAGRGVRCGPRGSGDAVGHRARRRRAGPPAGHPRTRADALFIVDAGEKAVIAFDPATGARTTIASGLPVGPPPGVVPKPLKGMPPFSGPQGPFAGIAAGPDGTLYVSADGEGSVLALRRDAHDSRGRDARRPPLPAGGAHPAQGDRRRGLSGRLRSCPPSTSCASGSPSAATPSGRRCAGCATTTWSRRGRGREPWWLPARRRIPMRRK